MADNAATAIISGVAAIVAGVAGALISRLTQKDPAQENRKRHLIAMFLEREDWPERGLDRLQKKIGADEKTTMELLAAIGAVQTIDDTKMWRLPARDKAEAKGLKLSDMNGEWYDRQAKIYGWPKRLKG